MNFIKNKKGGAGLIEGKPAYLIVVLALAGFLLLSVLAAVTIGSVSLTMEEVYGVLLYKWFNIGEATIHGMGTNHDIVFFIRLPRTLLALAVGMGLAISGSVMQAIIRNPLADPYVLGISSGASLGATIAVMLGVGAVFGSNAIGICAFIGAFGISLLVQLISSINGRSNSVKLLLAGMALSAVCSAFSNLIVFLSSNKEGMGTIAFWLMGSLAGANWENLAFILPCIVVITLFFITQHRTLNLMLLGDDTATTLGTNLHRYRQLYLLLSAFMIGLVVYCSGMIGFVGLLIPHLVRMAFGTDHKKLIPVSAFLGAIFLIWCDVACRSLIKGSELPIGILTSAIGSPIFVYMLVKKSYSFGGE